MTQRIPPEVAAQVARLFVDEAAGVFRAARGVAGGNRRVAEDAVQEAFRLAAERWDSIAHYPPERKQGWLCAVAIHKVKDNYRAWTRAQPIADPEDVARESQGVEQVVLTRLQVERCLKVISEMPEMRSRVAYLRFHDGWKNREIAAELGISRGTVGKHVSDARADLKRALPELTFTDAPDGDAEGEEAP